MRTVFTVIYIDAFPEKNGSRRLKILTEINTPKTPKNSKTLHVFFVVSKKKITVVEVQD